MKNAIPTIVCIFMFLIGNVNAQDYSSTVTTNDGKPTSHVTDSYNRMPNWEKHWTKESVIAIYQIIEEYGYPDEYSPNRMYWIIPGETNRTISYTENFLFDFPFETNSCNRDSLALISKSHL